MTLAPIFRVVLPESTDRKIGIKMSDDFWDDLPQLNLDDLPDIMGDLPISRPRKKSTRRDVEYPAVSLFGTPEDASKVLRALDEWLDTDNDKIGNNTDTDDDNDGILDEKDDYSLNKGPVIKLENENPSIELLKEYIFDASSSYDADGEIVSFLWEIDGEILKEGNSITHTFRSLGEHNLKLTIKDDKGESRTKAIFVGGGYPSSQPGKTITNLLIEETHYYLDNGKDAYLEYTHREYEEQLEKTRADQ